MPRAADFPRTLKRGPLRGHRFENSADYLTALHEIQGKKPTKDEWRFHLRMHAGSLDIEVSGDPRKAEDVDKLLDLLGKFGGAA